MNDRNRSNQSRISAVALSIAITMAAAIGLTNASEEVQRRATSIDTGVQRGGAPSLPSGQANDDPELMRTDRANEHHG